MTTHSAPAPLPASVLLLATCACRTTPGELNAEDATETRSAIERVLRAQESAWNRRDVAGFMRAGYWESPNLVFFSGGEVNRGFQPVLERYVARYAAPGQDTGRLAFSALEIEPLAAGAAFARGRWDLDFAAQPDVGGLFTLVLLDTPAGWRIVHDHTSVDG
jgi:beta-aspartyl-peptidase (threonine type)